MSEVQLKAFFLGQNACTAFPSTLVSMLELSPPLPILLLLRAAGLSGLNTIIVRICHLTPMCGLIHLYYIRNRSKQILRCCCLLQVGYLVTLPESRLYSVEYCIAGSVFFTYNVELE
jgi:hypothetical protein